MNKKEILNFLQNKKFKYIFLIVCLLGIIILGASIRVQNLDLLKDSTTGEYIPLALDPFYFLRLAETIVDNGGLPEVDSMRYPTMNVKFSTEKLPQIVVGMWKIGSIFDSSLTLRFVDVISPVFFFVIGILIFFLLIWLMTDSKWTALISSLILTLTPSYLYRTMAGFSDHEAIGMIGLFLGLVFFVYSFKKVVKKISWKKSLGFGVLSAIGTAVSIILWTGGAKFLFMILPMGFLIYWLFLTKGADKVNEEITNLVVFYSSWFVFLFIFAKIFGVGISQVFSSLVLTSTGFLSVLTFGFICIDFFMIKNLKKIPKPNLRMIWSGLVLIILGFVGLFILGNNPFEFVSSIIQRVLSPFGTGRVSLTVAENQQPYLSDWIEQTGKIFFYMFIAGMVFVGLNISKLFKKHKNRFLFVTAWVVFLAGLIFSRISDSSILNGSNFLSKYVVYFGSVLFLVVVSVYVFIKGNLKKDSNLFLIFAWLLVTLLAARSAVRVFFVMTPFVSFMVGYSIVNLFEYAKKSKDEMMRIVLWGLFIVGFVLMIYSSFGFAQSLYYQASYTGPSADSQWQNAMAWVRDNTTEDSVFLHWWDYGYWVQYLGERATVTDGGHAIGWWDHIVGRYVLTSPYSETALSFAKTQGATHLLIDSTDLGKYSAYSSIGGDENHDRLASLALMSYDSSQVKETSTGEMRVYQGAEGVEDDIVYESSDGEIFIPGAVYDDLGNPAYKAYIAGILVQSNSASEKGFEQPIGIFVYNNQQIQIPLRYLYVEGVMIDFGSGLESTAMIVSKAVQSSSGGISVDSSGSLIYLSPRVMHGLFAQLYLLDDVLGEFKDFELVHSEDGDLTSALKSYFGDYIGDFVIYGGNFYGPIKIWEINIPSNILEREEFLDTEGEYAEYDYLDFVAS